MKFIALLRGINVGGKRKVEMRKLQDLFKSLECTEVSTYLNSGNVLFESKNSKKTLINTIEPMLEKQFGFPIPLLVKTKAEIQKIAKIIPDSWKNNSDQKTDIAYLFKKVDSKGILDALPFREAFIDVKYVKGAIVWHVKRKNYNKSHLNKIISLDLYQSMTVRNVNTARFLAR